MIELHYLEGKSFVQVAALENVTVGWARRLHRRALSRLRKNLLYTDRAE